MQDQQGTSMRQSKRVRRQLVPLRPTREPTPLRSRLLVIGLAIVFCLLLAGMLLPRDRPSAELNTVPITAGKVEISLDAEALVVQRERVYTASAVGKVRRLLADGERARVGAPVVELLSGAAQGQPQAQSPPDTRDRKDLVQKIDQLSVEIHRLAVQVGATRAEGDARKAEELQVQLNAAAERQLNLNRQLGRAESVPENPESTGGILITADLAGVVVYQTDGLESRLNPAEAARWTPSWFRTLPAPVPHRNDSGKVAAGEPLFKVVDNLNQGLVTTVEAARLPLALPENRIQVRFSSQPGGTQSARIVRLEREGQEALLYMTVPFFPADWAGVRRVRITLVFAGFSGKVVPRGAIDVREGRQGVWAIEAGVPSFVPVRVVGGNERDVVVETDLSPGALVLRTAPMKAP